MAECWTHSYLPVPSPALCQSAGEVYQQKMRSDRQFKRSFRAAPVGGGRLVAPEIVIINNKQHATKAGTHNTNAGLQLAPRWGDVEWGAPSVCEQTMGGGSSRVTASCLPALL
ncbi:MAG: hypothetical protein KDD44_08740 [Bdellovibrionales bacterium]|nr:hypothetical protein [Bdellovibrionales bacterium]